MPRFPSFLAFTIVAWLAVPGIVPAAARAADPWLAIKGASGPGQGKHVVLVSGDEEYRSEEGLPQLAKILARHHGFDCTVLFAVDKDGLITPTRTDHIAGLEALKMADLMVILTRFRDLPDDEMKQIADYVDSGRPIVGLRTATHAFNLKPTSAYANYSWTSKAWDGGFGRQVLGETWINHHGHHGKQSTRGIIAPGAQGHPILRGINDGDIWGPTDVYSVRLPLPGDSKPLVLGQVLEGMSPTDKPVSGAERADDARRLGQNVHRQIRQARASLHHHDGGIARPAVRRHAAVTGQRLLLGCRPGRENPREERSGDRRRVQASALRLWHAQEGRQTIRPGRGVNPDN